MILFLISVFHLIIFYHHSINALDRDISSIKYADHNMYTPNDLSILSKVLIVSKDHENTKYLNSEAYNLLPKHLTVYNTISQDDPNTNDDPFFTLYPNLITFIPTDSLLHEFTNFKFTNKLHLEILSKRLFFHSKDIAPPKYITVYEPEIDSFYIQNGYLIHNGNGIFFVFYNQLIGSFAPVYFCLNCGFYIHIGTTPVFLNVTVEEVYYLSLITIYLSHFGTINNKKWPYMPCMTSNSQYLVSVLGYDQDWCWFYHVRFIKWGMDQKGNVMCGLSKVKDVGMWGCEWGINCVKNFFKKVSEN